ncbi:hypothetical protein VNI00_005129 [Paramarasmius palmivorus]|uniref:Major facilitator superfamily (MFS) profile domain-containing protein n=1 Tax=Paramarasmius palmivorus TaxID=297713 RepID=A0AAW0DHI7_9AGAR
MSSEVLASSSRLTGDTIAAEERHSEDPETDRNPVLESLHKRRVQSLEQIDNAPFSPTHNDIASDGCPMAKSLRLPVRGSSQTGECIRCINGVYFLISFDHSYALFAISAASIMIGYAYPAHSKPDENCPTKIALIPSYDLGLKAATSIGTIVGALAFGWLGDKFGRRRMYGAELLIIVVTTLGQAVSGEARAINIIGVLIMWRFLGGIGVGGDYPSSAIIASEFSPKKIRGRMLSAVFASQGWGTLTAALVTLIIISAYKNTIINAENHSDVDFMWRILIGFGCIPGILTLSSRIAITETPRYTMDIERDVQQAAFDVAYHLSSRRQPSEDETITRRADLPRPGWRDFRGYFSNSQNLKMLLGVSYTWFALDVSFYGLGLNSGTILQAISFGVDEADQCNLPAGEAVYNALRNVCIGNLILLTGLIPGYWACFLVIDKWGRRPIQMMGFVVLTGLFIILVADERSHYQGFGYDKLIGDKKVFLALYCLTNFFSNFGPNTTTFIIPAEAFPTRYRSTAYGIAAASGKLGSIITQVGFAKLKDIGGQDKFLGHILKIFAFFTLTGFIVSWNIPETKRRSLEELSNEDHEMHRRR